MQPFRLAALVAAVALAGSASAESVSFTVTKTADTEDGACDADCSLREAILAANEVEGLDFISFAIPSEGEPVTIAPASALPAITSPVAIDGETQAGASCAGLALTVSLDGSSAGPGVRGLVVAAPGSTVRGLAIHSFGNTGIEVSAPGATIACNRIGSDAPGTGGSGNEGAGILIASASDAIVGGDAPNSIRGNQGGGVWVFGESALRNRISRNEITGNGGEGIDLLGLDFEDPIDPDDSDEGPNRLQNSPEIESALYDAGASQLTVPYRVDSDPVHAAYPLTVEFFRTDDFDEGAVFLGSAEFDDTAWASGTPAVAVFTPSGAIEVGDSILATATDADGNTSEFPLQPTTVAPEPGAATSAAVALLAALGTRRARARG